MDNITKEIEMRKLMDVNLKTYHEKVNNLHDWEKEIKQKEKERKYLPQCEGRPAIRSQMHLQDMLKPNANDGPSGKVTATTINSEIFSPNDLVNINTSAYRQQGKIAVNEGNYKVALQHYSNAIELDDKDPTLYANRALCYLKLEKYEDCIIECGKTLRLAKDGDKIRSKACYRIMKAYEALGKYDLTVEYCKRLLAIEPNNIEAKDVLQQLTSKMVSPEKESPSGSSTSSDTYHSSDYSDNPSKASGDNTEPMGALNPLTQAIHFKDKGNDAIRNKNYELAMTYYSQAIQFNPSDPIYYSNRALSYLKLENYHECVRDCIRSIELNKNIDMVLKKAYYRKIIATEKLGDYKIAYEDCDLLLKMNPSNIEAQKAFERIKIILKEQNIENSKSRPWSVFDQSVKELKFIQKPPHKRSKNPLQRIKITDVDKSTIHLSKTIQNDRQNLNTITKMTKRISNAHVEQMFSEDHPKSADTTSKVNKRASNTSNNIYQKLLFSNPPMELKEPPVNVMNAIDNKLPNVSDGKMENKKKIDSENIDNKNKLDTTEKSTKMLSPVNVENLNKMNVSKKERQLTLPRNGPEFFSIWSELTMEYKCKYIKLIGDHNAINKVIGASLSDKILFEILTILSNYYIENNLSVIEVLTDLSKNNQMKIIPLFFSETEKKELETLFKYMINRKDDNTVINNLQEIYGVRI